MYSRCSTEYKELEVLLKAFRSHVHMRKAKGGPVTRHLVAGR